MINLIETIFTAQYILYTLSFIGVYMCLDAFLVDTEEEISAKHRHAIKHIYSKVINMSIKEIRSFLDNTDQNQGVIKINEITDDTEILFEDYEFIFSMDYDASDCYIMINNKKLNMSEIFDNFTNRFTLEYFYEVLCYHKFDQLICEDTFRRRNGLFL